MTIKHIKERIRQWYKDAKTYQTTSEKDHHYAKKFVHKLWQLHEEWKRKPITDRVLAGSTLCLAIGTMFLAYFGLRQTSAYERATKTENRPYLVVSHVGMNGLDSIKPITINISIKNVGKTPARLVHASLVNLFIGKFPDSNIPEPIFLDTADFAVIGATMTGEITTHCNAILSGRDFLSVIYNNRKLFFCGRVVYTDIFKESHYVDFGGCPETSYGFDIDLSGKYNDAN